MYRPTWAHSTPVGPQRWQETWARLLTPFTLWICVSVSIRYGYYGDNRMELGPSSSRLMRASSVFVQQVVVRDVDKKGVSLYAFSEEPELSHQANWSVSDYLIIKTYSRKGFSFWLNKGSRISMRLEAHPAHVNQLQVVMLKGERKLEVLQPKQTSFVNAFNESKIGKEAEYSIEEDDRYYLDIINTNPKSIIIQMNVNVSSKMHDTTNAKAICSTENKASSCQLRLIFPNTHYVILTTPNNGDLLGWYIELSFVARVITYIGILGFIVVMIFLILKYLGACDAESSTVVEDTRQEINETYPIVPRKTVPQTYGTNEEDDDSGASSSSSEELYDEKLCVICYDEQRNCFFVPCGHCATCYDCAQRIMDGESKVCPICRRLINKVRRLFNS
ncbi:putative transcription factor C2H2 family [Rosa chinensis]|uniref:Putative transcription factor C2H2 family n=1 Tax=Rosa chinensis TaxID=74649 RepID=A0A2P6Q0S7_ROSCH|nr:E3 ubiquitin-protein ligase APD2 [Rosa chinensis]PRQ27791.1 putative transcription factor C2H2 family [Rosa chinensis]